MRLPRWAPWIEDILRGSPAIGQVRTLADDGITDPRYGHILTLRTGAQIALQWVRTSAATGEDHSEPEVPVTGEPLAPVELPDLPASGRVPLELVEAHLAALIINGSHPEIRAVERKSQRPDPGPRPCCVTVHCYSQADIFGLFWQAAPAGAALSSGGDFQQRKEV